jgi:uncharacterized protein
MQKANYIFLLLVAVFFVTANTLAQTNTEKRIIEVTGSAETLIMPNEFTFKITLVERIEKKDKLTIESQEENLKAELVKLGVDVQKDLTIFDLNSVYISRKKTKDTLGSKDFRLKIKDLAKIERLQEIADRLNIANLDLIESTHSDLTTFRKETKMEAIRAAKAKAEYLLGAIGEKVGKPVFVKEIEEESPSYRLSNINSNSTMNNIRVNTDSNDSQNSTTLSFSKIKLRYEVLTRFEIE